MSNVAELQRRVEVLRRRERLLAEFAQHALRPGIQIDELLTYATNFVHEGLRVRYVKVLQYRADRADLLIVSGWGWKPGVVGNVALSSGIRSPAGRAFQTGQPVLIDDITKTTEFDYSPVLRDHGVISLLNVPIVAETAIWGVLEADSAQAGEVDEHDAQFLYVFAHILGEAIQRCTIDKEREDSLKALEEAAERRTLLLREMQHRFRNNLNLIQALFAFRAKAAKPDVRAEIQHLSERVTAIRMAQDQLAFDQDLSAIHIAAYIHALASHLKSERTDIEINAKADEAVLPVEQAIPLGLIINEAVTNALKHAFKDKGGKIEVAFKFHNGRAKVSVEDTGAGRVGDVRGQGLLLIEMLATQIGGRAQVVNRPEGGVAVVVDFDVRRQIVAS